MICNMIILLLKLSRLPNILKSVTILAAILAYGAGIFLLLRSARAAEKRGAKLWRSVIALLLLLGICRMLPYLDFRTRKIPVELIARTEATEETNRIPQPYAVYESGWPHAGRSRPLDTLPREAREVLADEDFAHYTYIETYRCVLPSELSVNIWESRGFPIPLFPQVFDLEVKAPAMEEGETVYFWRIPKTYIDFC